MSDYIPGLIASGIFLIAFALVKIAQALERIADKVCGEEKDEE